MRKLSTRRWGAELQADGTANFRLWAPSIEQLSLDLKGRGALAMKREDDGWHEISVEEVAAGQDYGFLLPNGALVPDPASRAQARDVHSYSLLIDSAFEWQCAEWQGRPWEEAVVYELHPGTFTEEGTFGAIQQKLDHLVELGVTAIELMPVAQFSGNRGWGYDGVLLYCPHSAYGGADGLKRLVDAAHARGLMMILDVVYNHFGPDGNYISSYVPEFFDPKRQTPWGAAIRFQEPAVRAFFLDNALYWLEEFRFDGLRFDAIDQIQDSSPVPILEEMARTIRARCGDRPIHLMTEDERNIVSLHPRDAHGRPLLFTAEWNDDFHHAAHCIATGEKSGYYAAFAEDPLGKLTRALATGFVYQGEAYLPWQGKERGVASGGQPPDAFVSFLQNHDQIGNRAFGERLSTLAEGRTVELLTAILLLNPQIPLLYMGEEYGETRPFLFFTDFHGDLAAAVREGRRNEFREFVHFSDAQADRIPDPNDLQTFRDSKLDWARLETGEGRARFELHQRLLRIRQEEIVPRLPFMHSMQGRSARLGEEAFLVAWEAGEELLTLYGNFGEKAVALLPPFTLFDRLLYGSRDAVKDRLRHGELPAGCVALTLRKLEGAGNGI